MPPGVVAVGVDVVDTARFATVIARTPSLVTRVFTSAEIAGAGAEPARARSLAVRWAAKEAVAKALVQTRGLAWHDCQVLTGDHGEPRIEVRGTVAQAASARGIDTWHVSLSHDGVMAVAFVVASRAGAR